MAKPARSTKWRYLAGALATLLIAGAVFFWSRRAPTIQHSPRRGPVVEAVYGLGTVVAPRTFQAKLGVSRIIRKVFVKEGDVVRAGQALIQLDEGDAVKAPFAGTVTLVSQHEGEIVFPQAPTVTLADLTERHLEISLEQQSVLRVKSGQKAWISFESLRNERLEGAVSSVYPRENQFIVRVDPERFPVGVLPGMTADVAIEIGRKENALLIPLRSIAAGQATLLRAGKRLKVPVKVGVVDGEWAEVVSGDIAPEDQLLVRTK
jgi:multidrug efflux pump subunit AcrA (membrane-fusion protein)